MLAQNSGHEKQTELCRGVDANSCQTRVVEKEVANGWLHVVWLGWESV